MSRRPANLRIALAWAVVILVGLFVLVPLAIMVLMSFSTSEFIRFPPPGYSLRWFSNFFARADWTEAALRSIRIGAIVTAAAVGLGVPAALALAAMSRRAANALAAALTLPILMPPVVVALAMYMSFTRYGIAGSELAIVLGHLCLALPFVVLTTLAALRGLDPDLVRAARASGAGRIRVLRTVTLPLAAPGIFSGAVLAFLTSFDELLIALFVGSSTTRTLPRRMWEGIRSEFDPTVAAASTVLVAGTLVLGILVLVLRHARASRTA
ncbi:ABC transporter permease [Propylenella binzhouense]|uniref:ABC transporter permease n=1 Tax=Propylenella binzhouense TaxID=2555902 RepID=A0A964T4Z5_9HYPH|nr:ABC transporter permease [Propylenella binzhouense]MYZ48608.1 ABC transporter permease [Propylenella binzhouense]